MEYDEEKDEYICHNKKRLKVSGIKHRTSVTGYKSEITVYTCENCKRCPYKNECKKSQGNKSIQVSKLFIEKRTESFANITTELGKQLRMNRSIQV